jgi:hypothetical protein
VKHVRQPTLQPLLAFLDNAPRGRTGRGPDCLSHARLDQLALGELSNTEAAATRQHLAGCAACTEVAQALEQDRAGFVASVDIGARAADALARASLSSDKHKVPWWRRHWPVLAPAALAAAGLLLVLAPKSGERSTGDEVRTKGTFGLSVYVLHAEAANAPQGAGEGTRGGLHLGEALHAGDHVRFGLRGADATGASFVLGVDDAGQVSVYHASASGAAPVASATGERLLPEAIELDATLGNETLIALRCRGAVDTADVAAAAKRRGSEGSLGLPCDEARYVIKKVPR